MFSFVIILKGIQRLNSNRVLRGGSWINNARNLRSANRNANTPDNRNDNIGLRLAGALLSISLDAKYRVVKNVGGSINQLNFLFESLLFSNVQQNQDPQCVKLLKTESLLLGRLLIGVSDEH